MKIFKYLLFLLLIFIIGASIYIATKDGKFQVEKKEMMAAPQEVIFNEVNDFTTWKSWEPWSQEATDMIINYGEKTSGEGASYSWSSEEMGEGEIETTKANPFTNLEQIITFKTPFGESTSDIYWEFQKEGDSTLVTWGMKGEQNFMEKAAFLFQDESLNDMMQPMFTKGLNNLEEVLREKMDTYSVNIAGITQHGGGYYMYVTTASKISQVSERMPKMIDEVDNYMTENNIEQVGNPFVLYNQWNEEAGTAIYSSGFFTPSEVIVPAESSVLTGFMPNQRTLKITLKGDYTNLKEAWDTAYAYIQENGLVADVEAQAFEVYATGPKDNANPAKWITHIYIPLKKETPVK
ncbi:SRPBCC family protein [Christiangramia sabulilitoris]|uniref:AraC family transcriptional regulator n=1 Tax=Christiangramia sabulilitoris TaxID=2583991 RepID=A0A550HZ11_9FLAO|nr:GyrI-like domain-containing protein [Christiangramia sabulilitoris]TRO63974.1 AraC family transcriptional regulator [Christiangramia sabulilitoris]